MERYPPIVEEGIVRESLAIPNGGVEGWITCNLNEAKIAIDDREEKAGRGRVKLKKDFVQPWFAKEVNHSNNIDALTQAGDMISQCKA